MIRGGRKTGRKPLKERTRRPEDAPPFAVGHRIRLEALAILHEGQFSASEIAKMLGEDVRTVTNHLHRLYNAGCIEFAGHESKRNFSKAVYRAVTRPLLSNEKYRAMAIEERHDLNGAVVQWILTECLSSYRHGKMDEDDDLCLLSDEPTLDAEGRRELREFLTTVLSGEQEGTPDALESVQEIRGRAAHRMAKSGEKGKTMFVAVLAFERGRSITSKHYG